MRRRPSFHLAAVLFAGAVVAVSACAQGGTAQTWTYPPAAAGASAPAAGRQRARRQSRCRLVGEPRCGGR